MIAICLHDGPGGEHQSVSGPYQSLGFDPGVAPTANVRVFDSKSRREVARMNDQGWSWVEKNSPRGRYYRNLDVITAETM